MARLPTTLMAQPIRLAGAWTCTARDAAGSPRTVTIVAGGSTVYARPYLAKSIGAGSVTDPFELFILVQTALNTALPSGWTIQITTDARTKVTYNDAGTGRIDSGELTALLGFTGAVGPLATGASQTSTYPPVGLIAAFSLTEDSGWEPLPSHVAASMTAGGVVVAVTSELCTVLRTFGLRFHPRTWAEQPSGEYISPAFPPDASPALFTQPVAPTKASVAPWSVHEFLMTAAGKKCGFALSNAQQLIANTIATFDVGYLAPETYERRRGRAILPQQSPTWNARRDWPGLTLTRITTESR